jgi:hypothetical protein
MYDSTKHGIGSWGYKLYIAAGLIFLFGSPFVLHFIANDPSGYGTTALLNQYYVPGLTLFFGGILAYWWYILFFADTPPKINAPVDDPSLLQNWDSLFQAMATGGGDPQRLKRLRWVMQRGLLIFMSGLTLLVMFPSLGFLLGFMSFSGVSPNFGVFVGVYLTLTVILQVVFFIAAGQSVDAFNEMLPPLGLQITETPDFGEAVVRKAAGAAQTGVTVIAGMRHSRPVRIVTDVGETTTRIGGSVEAFTITSTDGKLEAQPGAPESVRDALRPLRKAKRWKGITVSGGADGITVTRKGIRTGNEWLTDLWLAERIARLTT